MKNILKLTTLMIVLLLSGCKDDASTSQHEMEVNMLTAAPWGNAVVTHTPDGDLSDQYTNFAIVFTNNTSDGFDGTYFVSNGGYAFSEDSGMWRFNDDMTKIIFDSEMELDYTLDEANLHLDFIVPEPAGRMAGISGHFVFDLQPL